MIKPSDDIGGNNKSDIRETGLDSKLPHTVLPDKCISQKTCGKRYQQTAPDAKQTAYDNQVDHAFGKEIEDATRQIDGECHHYYFNFAFRQRQLPRKQYKRDYEKVRQHGQELNLQFRRVREYLVQIA